jgi:hypothetical protein
MNPEVKKKWLEALRSEEYTQGRGCLRRYDNYCCLGVLCDVYSKEHPDVKWKKFIGSERYYHLQGGAEPSETVLDWASLFAADMATLMKMNDDLEFSFGTIANYIEKEL